MQFRFEGEFDNKIINELNKCPAKCKLCDKFKDQIFCELNLWHQNNHKFSCEHDNLKPCHTIFIIDKSDSMGSQDLKPKCNKIKKEEDFNNRLGCVLQVIDNYIKKRLNIDKEDLFSFITFSTNSKIIFKDYNNDIIQNEDWLKKCMDTIQYPQGNTFFLEGFKKGKEILSTIDRKKYKPIIILLSDGDNYSPTKNETINYVKNVSIYYFLII